MTASIEPHLWFDDVHAGVEWYRSVLDFEIVSLFPDEGPTWFQLQRDGAGVMIAVTPPATQSVDNQAYLAGVAPRLAGQGAPLSLYLHVDDAEILEPIWDAWWGGRQFTVADPVGTWWTVFQATAPR